MLIFRLSLVVVLGLWAFDRPVSCDLLELNRLYDDRGSLVLKQVIAWDWHDRDATFHVAGWRTVKGDLPNDPLDRGPVRRGNTWQCHMLGLTLTAPAYRETWTQDDPEERDRHKWPTEKRRLSKI